MPRRPGKTTKRHKLTVRVKKPKKVVAAEKIAESSEDSSVRKPDFGRSKLTVHQPVKILSEKVERDKRLIMWSGVVFFMLLIVVVWIFSLRQEFKNISARNNDKTTSIEWEKISEDLKAKLGEMNQNLETIKEFSTEEINNAVDASSTNPNATSTGLNYGISSFPQAEMNNATATIATSAVSAEIEKLKTKLEKLK